MLEGTLTMTKRDVSILNDKELEYAKQAFFKSKEIKALRDRVEQLEKNQALAAEKFKHRTKELRATVSKELEEATLDSSGLRRLLKMKNKELRQMKSLAATILCQRTETEQFFLEALQEVKELIRLEKKRTPTDAKVAADRLKHGAGTTCLRPSQGIGGRRTQKSQLAGHFPPLNVKPANVQFLEAKAPSALPASELDVVNIGDLSWDDKEMVLRVLFAKMNGIQKAVDNAVRSGERRAAPSIGPPVFISQGVDLPDGDEEFEHYQKQFAMPEGEDDDDENDPDAEDESDYM
jgi:hypothetical protein